MGISHKDFDALCKRQGIANPSMVAMPKANKYRVAPKEERTCDGIVFASKREMQHYQILIAAHRAGLIASLVLQPRFELLPKMQRLDGKAQRAMYYQADFEYLRLSDDQRIVCEVKGMETEAWKIKEKLFRAKYPHLRLEIVR